MYTGNESIYTYTFQHQKKPECPVCGGEKITVTRDPNSSLQDLIDMLLERQDLCVIHLSSQHLFRSPPKQLQKKRLGGTDTLVMSCTHRQIRRPSLRVATKSLYMQAPPQLEVATRPNLEKSLNELLESGDVVTVTDASLPFSLDLIVKLE